MMETAKSLLNDVKRLKNIESDYALAKILTLHRGLISDYYSGKRTPNEFACLQIAQALGKSYEEVSAIVRIEAEKDEKRRQIWRDYYRRIGGVAASIMLIVSLLVTLEVTFPENVYAKSTTYQTSITNNTNYAFFTQNQKGSSCWFSRPSTYSCQRRSACWFCKLGFVYK
jgi:hypothetical protein